MGDAQLAAKHRSTAATSTTSWSHPRGRRLARVSRREHAAGAVQLSSRRGAVARGAVDRWARRRIALLQEVDRHRELQVVGVVHCLARSVGSF